MRANILQWYHNTLQQPEIKQMQATLIDNLYWFVVDAAALVHTCETYQKCKLTAVKNMGKSLYLQATS
jgi:hypothetical protein